MNSLFLLFLYSKIITGKHVHFTSNTFYMDNGENVACKMVKYITILFVKKEF